MAAGIDAGSGGRCSRIVNPAVAASPNAFTLRLECDNGKSYDIFVNDGHSVAAWWKGHDSRGAQTAVHGRSSVRSRWSAGREAGDVRHRHPRFTALVLFTPASLADRQPSPARLRSVGVRGYLVLRQGLRRRVNTGVRVKVDLAEAKQRGRLL